MNPKSGFAKSSELEQQTRESDGENIYVSNNKVGIDKKGWSLTLGPNERVTVKPTMILRTAVVTIRKYETKTIHTEFFQYRCLFAGQYIHTNDSENDYFGRKC